MAGTQQHPIDDLTAGRSLGRRALLGGGGAIAGSAVILGGADAASASGGQRRLEDEANIKQLSVNYALGTDAVSAGDVDRALALYAMTFAENAPIAAGFDRANPSLSAIGPTEWAERVSDAFIPYSATQHLLGTINVEFDPNRKGVAQMTTYLHATHVYAAKLELLTVLGTYIDTVERIRRVGWRITNRFLQFTSFETSPRLAPPATP